ncbi:MAG: DUF4416 family protein [Candidatus Sumerlaeota bacterium]|nr:DUF4416 family protein [Candidatus Sumerlaeota bacterium]
MAPVNPHPEPALLFFSLLGPSPQSLDAVCERLGSEPLFGRVIMRSAILPFSHSRYYEREMGSNLLRQWVLTDRLIGQEEIIACKLRSNEIEDDPQSSIVNRQSAIEPAGRTVNIDPGYLNFAKVVLATTKDYSHRLYLGRGIYAEVTLAWHSKARGYEPWPWTYPDHREPAALEFFSQAREEYKRLLANARQETH